ncbi:MAG: methionine-rich copper-binding protein CopC [Paracoccaceae bacterium]|jgi:methionine-rich copper-binding protein CopC
MRYKIGLAILMVLVGTSAFAHSKKEGMTPADGAVVETIPESIELRFNDGMRLTKVEMTHADTYAGPLEIGAQSGFVKEFSLPFVPMGPGVYQIEWRGLGSDGHPMNGTFSFEVK